jgi:hypothetical protein
MAILIRQIFGLNGHRQTDLEIAAEADPDNRVDLAEVHRRELEKIDRAARGTLIAGVVGGCVVGSFALVGHLLDNEPIKLPAPTTSSVCYNAQLNVVGSLNLMKVNHFSDLTPARLIVLEAVNPTDVDASCRNEDEIAKALLPA